MVGISEILQTIGAVVIFSLILLTANRMIQINAFQEVQSESEGMAVDIAQNIIEEAQTKAFDANTADDDIPVNIPKGFSSCGPGPGEDRSTFNDFDDYDGYETDIDTRLTKGGIKSFHLNVAVSYVSPPDYDMKSGSKNVPTKYKKMVVAVTSDYLKNNSQEIKLSYLRRYYKTQNK